MMDSMTAQEVMRYLGLETVEELEDVCVEYDLDVEVANNGEIMLVHLEIDPTFPWPLRHVLFDRHEKRHGFRPDDEEAMKKQAAVEKAKETKARNARAERRALLHKRMAKRPKEK